MSEQKVFQDFKLTEESFVNLIIEQMLQEQVLIALLDVVQDGICFLSKDLDVIYGNPTIRFWYELEDDRSKVKCYEAYHNRKEPCEDCPALRAIESKKPEMGEQVYEKAQKRQGWQNIFCFPILNEDGDVILLIEYIKDVTDAERMELSVELMKNSIATMTRYIEEKEKALREKEQQLASNMNKTLSMVMRYLEKSLDPVNYELVARQLELTRTGVDSNSAMAVKLSGQEMMIARYIADGYVSKEIAEEMQISKKTVDYHRTNLRKKFGLRAEDSLKQAIREFFVNSGL